MSHYIEGPSSINNAYTFQYQGGSGVVSRAETIKNNNSAKVSNGMGSIARMRAPTNTQGLRTHESRTGSNGNTGFRKKETQNLPYPEYFRRKEEGRCFHCRRTYNPDLLMSRKEFKIVHSRLGEFHIVRGAIVVEIPS